MNIVLDANLIASLVLPLPYSEDATAQMLAWKRQQARFVASALWSYEVSTVLRRALLVGHLPADKLDFILEQIWRINILDVPATFELQQQSLAWAARLGQSKAYGSAYLATAETLQSEFWTADHRLAQAARQSGASWVHTISAN